MKKTKKLKTQKKKAKKKTQGTKRRAVKGKKSQRRKPVAFSGSNEQKEFSWKRQQLLERQLSGQDQLTIRGGGSMTDATWGAIAGGGGGRDSGPPRLPQRSEALISPPPETRGPSSGGPFDRGNDTRNPFNRR